LPTPDLAANRFFRTQTLVVVRRLSPVVRNRQRFCSAFVLDQVAQPLMSVAKMPASVE
jgi:hypothetical protein